MPIAEVRIRDQPTYRREAFVAGLVACGYELVQRGRPKDKRDLLVIWNRYGINERDADIWERNGGSVLVVENGYIGADDQGRQLYAISVHGHNGSGWFPVGDEDRFSQLRIPLLPWKRGGEYFLVCGQRGIGSRLMASPAKWLDDASKLLKPIRDGHALKMRLHPGRHAPAIALEEDLREAFACVVWSSSSGVKALASGVPVYYGAPYWIAYEAAHPLRKGEVPDPEPLRSDLARASAMHRVSHGQWMVDEIMSGEPFARMLAHIENLPTWH